MTITKIIQKDYTSSILNYQFGTFMRMKEDHLGTGQLKPGYNVQHGVDSEYITWVDTNQKTNDTQALRVTSIYECKECKGCPCKTDCIHGNHCKTPIEERKKTLHVQKTLNAKRKECVERITSDYGKQLRMNRSIQVEGSFADIKADMGFRRYTYRGMENILAQNIILAIAHNINKLHNKIQNDRTGQHLFELKKSA